MISTNTAQFRANLLTLEKFQERQKKIAGFFREAIPILKQIGSTDVERAQQALLRLQNETFKVLVIGEFKRGKSTFINALLGEQILPSFSWPCTAVINEVKYCEEKKAVLYFKYPLPSPLPKNLSQEATEHIKHAKYEHVPPLEIPIDKLEQYVTIGDTEKDQAESIAESPYQKVEIFWPLPILKRGIEIIDSPGLNENQTRTDVVTNYIDKVDAIIWVLTCQAFASISEIEQIEKATQVIGHKEIFFVCNFFDQIKVAEQSRLQQYGTQKLQGLTDISNGIHFISSLKALESKTGIDDMSGQRLDPAVCQTRLQESRFEALEKSLFEFLAQRQGNIKLFCPMRQLSLFIDKAINEIIPAQKKMSESSIQTLQQRLSIVDQRREETQRHKHQIMARMNTKLQQLKSDIHAKIHAQILYCFNQIPMWVTNYQPKSDVSIFSMKSDAKKLTEEIIQYIRQKIDEEMQIWCRNTLLKSLVQGLQEIAGGMHQDIANFSADIAQMKADVFGIQPEELSDQYKVSDWERILAGTLGLVLGGVGSGVVGMQLGFKDMFISLLPSFGIALGAILLNITNPLFIIPMLLGAAGIQGVIKTALAAEKIKTKIAETCIQHPAQIAYGITTEFTKQIFEEIDKRLVQEIIAGLDKEIQDIQDQVQYVITSKKQSESDWQAKQKEFDTIVEKLNALKKASEEAIYEIYLAKPNKIITP